MTERELAGMINVWCTERKGSRRAGGYTVLRLRYLKPYRNHETVSC